MEHVLLIRYDEIHLKGLNRPFFERKLINSIKCALSGLDADVKKEQGRIYVYGVSKRIPKKLWTGLPEYSAYIR